MIGGLHGNWALMLLIYTGLFALAIAAHGVWVMRKARDIWHSSHRTVYKMALTTLLIVTPIVGFYAVSILRNLRASSREERFYLRDLVMPATGICAVLACTFAQTLNYSPDFRTWQVLLGLIPGFLAFYCVMQLIFYMAVSVSGLSQRGFLLSRTHLVSTAILLATGFFIR